MDLALNKLQRLIYHKTQTNKQANLKSKSRIGVNDTDDVVFLFFFWVEIPSHISLTLEISIERFILIFVRDFKRSSKNLRV